ncbi:toxin glutamine deamidase domain-containing protein [Nocardia sp. NPDC056541]|uniref:toxin glutamine deamidase domain-containing protein n=1 Tax=Nocardia sp. NPDC056541 TaxID=3345860 RepID=UPI0036725FC5
MGIEIPDELAWVAKYILGAGDWPEGDETAMRRVADGWTAMASTLDTVDDNAALALNAALTALSEGETHTAITAYRDKLLSGDEATFTAVRKWCAKQAELLEDGANDIEHTKLVIIATMVIAAVEIGAAIATSWTGVGAVAGVAARVAAQVAVRVAIKQLIARMLTRGAAKAAARLALRGAAFEALEEGGTDLGARLIQVAKGDRSTDKFGWTDLGLATFGGAVGGAAGGLLGGGTGALGDVASSTAGKLAGKVVGGTVTELGADLSAQVATAGVGAAFLGQEFKLDVGVDTFTSAGAGGVQSALESSSHGGNSTAPTVPDLGTDVPGSTTPAGTDTPSGDQSPNASDNTGPNAPATPSNGDTGGSTNPASTAPTGDGATPQDGSPNTSAPGESTPSSPSGNGATDTPPTGDSTPSSPNNNGSTDAGQTAPSSNGSPSPGDTAPSSPNGNGSNPTPPPGDTTPSTPNSDTPTATPQTGESPSTPNSNAPTETPSTGDTSPSNNPTNTSPTGDTSTPNLTGSSLDLPTQDSSTQPNTPTDTTPNTNSGQQNPTPSDNGHAATTPTTPANPQPTTPAPTHTPDTTTSTPTQESATQQSPTSTPAATTGSPLSTTSQPATPSNNPTHTPADTTRPSSTDTSTATATTATAPQTPNPTTPTTSTPAPAATPTSTSTPPISQIPPSAPPSPRSITTPPATTGTPQPTPPPTSPTASETRPATGLDSRPSTTTPTNAAQTTPQNTTPTTTSTPTPAPTNGSPDPGYSPDARPLRDALRHQPPHDGRTTTVGANQNSTQPRPSYRIRRFQVGNRWVSVATIRAHIPNAHLMSPAELSQEIEFAQRAVDAAFNHAQDLHSGDQFLVDLELTTDPAAADLRLNLQQHPFDLSNDLREHMGLPRSAPDTPLSPDDLRSISNDIARANTPSPLADMPGTRVFAPGYLRGVEIPQHQHAVEDALRDGNRFMVGADPRTNPYGRLINDGGPHVTGRNINCLDASLAALASFNGRPEVSAPRTVDLLPDGTVSRQGERNGPDRAAAWLGGQWQTFANPNQSVPDRFQALHDWISQMGPGSSALVLNDWQGGGGHATAIVYPIGASGPVWWDPQQRTFSDSPPASLTSQSSSFRFMTVDQQGAANGAATTPNSGTSAGLPGSDIPGAGVQSPPEPTRLDLPRDSDPGGDRGGDGSRPGELRGGQGDRSGHHAVEPGTDDDRRDVRRSDRDRDSDPSRTDLSPPESTDAPTDPARPGDDRVPGDGRIAGDNPADQRRPQSDNRQGDLGSHSVHTVGPDGGREGGVESAAQRHVADNGDIRGVVDTSDASRPADAGTASQSTDGTTAPTSQSSVNQTPQPASQTQTSLPPSPTPPPTTPGTSPAPVNSTTPAAHQSSTPAQSIPTAQQVDNANQSRAARENLRSQHPDGGVRQVANPQGGRSFAWGRFTTAFAAPVSVLRVGVRVTGTGNLDPAVVQALLEQAQLAVDLHFNRGEQLLSGDWMMVDLVPVSDPATADMTIDLDPSNPHSTPADADLDTLTELLREQLGLPPGGTDLDVDDIRELSNSIARANTPAALDGLPDTRVEGPERLDSLEHAEYQHDVEDALRDGNRFLVGADPRTNDYGRLINDGGPSAQGRSNNCLDGSLAALSSFNGRPEVGSPRWPDLDADGNLDTRSGEQSGIDRATAWLGGSWQLGDINLAVSAQFQALHDQIRSMGPGASALVVNTWHARDEKTGELLYESDGSPTIDGSHATVIVYPHGAAGPVWWDPQTSEYSDTPPHNLTSGSVELWSMPVDTQGVANAGSTAGHQGTSAGIPSGSVSNPDLLGDRVQPRVGVPTGAEPGTESSGPGTRPDELRSEQTDRDSDSAPQPAPVDDRRDVRPGDRDRSAGERASDLSQTPTGGVPSTDGEQRNDHIPSDRDVVDQSAGTNRDVPADVQQTNPGTGPTRTHGLTGDLESPVAQPQTTELADGRDDRGLVSPTTSDQRGLDDSPTGVLRPDAGDPDTGRSDDDLEREPRFSMVDAAAAEVSDLVELQRLARRAANVGWKTMGGALDFTVGEQTGTFAGFSGTADVSRNAAVGTQLPPIAPPSQNNSIVPDISEDEIRRNDAENNLLEHLHSQLSDRYPLDENNQNQVSGRVRLFSEQEPCQSCNPTIRAFQRMYPNIEIEVYYILPYPPLRRDRPTL